MPEQIAAPYGSWTSPIEAADLAASVHPVTGAVFVDGEAWWAELRSAEGGRYAIRRAGDDGEPVDVLPAPWNARTRVHEYGGGAWTIAGDGTLVFAEFSDQRLYVLEPGGEPRPLTPADAGLRFGDLGVHGDAVLAVRETHAGGAVARDLVLVPLDGSAAGDATRIRSLAAGSDFLAYPRFSPDGTRLAWIAWDHPRMPWDGTELRVGRIADGVVAEWEALLGGPGESVLQPEWIDDDSLYALSDRSGWWNLYRVSAGTAPVRVHERDADLGGPLWGLGFRFYLPRADGRVTAVYTHGNDELVEIDPAAGDARTVETGFTSLGLCDVDAAGRVLALSGSAEAPAGLRLLGPDGAATDVRLGLDDLPDPEYLPHAEEVTFTGRGRDVHAFVYPPHNPEFTGAPGELPPYVAFVHGGPTAHVQATLSLKHAFYTSRGIGVIDVNYGGSSGYGREYRERLKGRWGVVDVEDTVTAVLGLAEAGRADRDRLAIEGGSAGGWTVLAALTGTDVFGAGISYYGVAELLEFVKETHDFESRYVDGLVGPLPEARDLYVERAPLSHVDELGAPVLLLQGLDDPIVPPAQAERFRDALVAKGIPHAYVAYEGESHGFRRAETIIHSREAGLSFYGQVFGFAPPGVPELELWRPEG